jgi:hypothetical protein
MSLELPFPCCILFDSDCTEIEEKRTEQLIITQVPLTAFMKFQLLLI